MAADAPQPLISVVIPTYNRACMLKEAVDSVLAQDFSAFEVVVVDDGSTDNTPAVLARYGARLRVLHQPNRGVSAARNRGICASRGLYVAFLDSDDLWLPQKLTAQAAFFDAHPEAVICQTEEIWIRRGVRVNPRQRHRKPSGMIFERSLELCLVSPSAVMVRRDLFDRVGCFDERLPACEDYDLWLRISRQLPIHLIETPLIIKRGGHPDQLSQMAGLDRFRIDSIHRLLEAGKLTSVQHAAAVRVLQAKCKVYGSGCRKRGRVDEADYYAALAERFAGGRRKYGA